MTIRKISERAGVSTATVSRVMNKNPNVAADLVKAVEKAMDELGCLGVKKRNVGRPHKVVTGFDCGIVALLIPDAHRGALLTTLSSRLCHGIERTLRAHGLNLIVTGLTEDNRVPGSVVKRKVDGVIVRTGPVNGLDLPSVFTFEQAVGSAITRDLVVEDNSGIGHAAAGLLIERGHRRLALISPEAHHPSLVVRSLFFRQHAEREGASVVSYETSVGGHLAELVGRCLADPTKPTGLFSAGHDAETLRLIRLICESTGRKSIDIVCCHNDAAMISAVDPGAIVLDIQPEEIGSAAAEQLIWRRQNPKAGFRRVVIPYRAIVG